MSTDVLYRTGAALKLRAMADRHPRLYRLAVESLAHHAHNNARACRGTLRVALRYRRDVRAGKVAP